MPSRNNRKRAGRPGRSASGPNFEDGGSLYTLGGVQRSTIFEKSEHAAQRHGKDGEGRVTPACLRARRVAAGQMPQALATSAAAASRVAAAGMPARSKSVT